MKKKYTAEELNHFLNNNQHLVILIRDEDDNFHYISSKANWLRDAELIAKAIDLVDQRLQETDN